MKKIFINFLFIILVFFTINTATAFEVKQVSREEIDKIKCDLHFKGELQKGYNYTFHDTFINSSTRDVKVGDSRVHIYEEEDFNQSDFFSEANFSAWAKEKNNIYKPGDRGVITEIKDNYKIKKGPKKTKQDNFIIKYTLDLYYKGSDGKFSDGPHPHTECKQYRVVPEEIDDTNIKIIYNKYKKIENRIKEIEIEENQKGRKIINLPQILPKTGTPVLEKTKRLTHNKLVDTEFKNERFILAGSKNSDIEFWKKVLDERDRNADKYLVLPSNGLVIPINDVPQNTSDFNKLISGREIELNKYLKTGSMEYPGTSTNGFGQVGNKVVFGHSSYWKKDDGRYKTDFGKIIELDPGEEIWIYEKQNGKYVRYRYEVKNSYNTNADDTSVLNPGIGKNLTLFTCTPIGGIAGRWIIKAKFIDEEKIDLEKKIKFEKISRKLKIKINNIIKKVGKNKKLVLKIFNSIIEKENQLSKQKETKKIVFIKNILEYLKYKLALEYYK